MQNIQNRRAIAESDAAIVQYYESHAPALEASLSSSLNAVLSDRPENPVAAIAVKLLSSLPHDVRLKQLGGFLLAQIGADDDDDANALDGPAKLAALREFLVGAMAAVTAAEAEIVALQERGSIHSSRAGYLEPLIEKLGPPPSERSWEDEWVKARAETVRVRHAVGAGKDPRRIPAAEVAASERRVAASQGVATFKSNYAEQINHMVSSGWPEEEATRATLISRCCDTAVGEALRERDPRYAAMTYACTDALIGQARRQQQRRAGGGGGGGGGSGREGSDSNVSNSSLPPDVYKKRHRAASGSPTQREWYAPSTKLSCRARAASRRRWTTFTDRTTSCGSCSRARRMTLATTTAPTSLRSASLQARRRSSFRRAPCSSCRHATRQKEVAAERSSL